mmetsp:Transcript_10970/g.16388  ORF Transcript_10970/g.16388 Transcript_10970/m.16388 type:complete len:152 (+) Transcript_10970:760-1215(+)
MSGSACSDMKATESKVEKMPSVGVEAMDKEHEECAEAIAVLKETGSPYHLMKLKDVIEEHFNHEEKLFKETGFDDGGKFSKTKSHCTDHRKILAEIGQLFNNLNTKSSGGEVKVPLEVVKLIEERLVKHTGLYDSQYSSHMQEHFKKAKAE